MKRSYLRWLRAPDSDEILNDLTTRQHLFPHRPLRQTLAESAAALGFCPAAAEQAIEWLRLDPASAVGRLQRTELAQLARCVYRFWRQSLSAETSQSQPA